MALATQGFQLQQLPPLPVIPSNVGTVDVKAIYDRVKQGLDTADAIRTEVARQKQANEEITLETQKAQAGQAVLPSATAAQIGQSNVLAAQNNPKVATLAGEAATQGASNTLASGQLDAQELSLLKTLTPQQFAAYKQVHGFGKTGSTTTARDPSTGALTTTSSEAVNVPGAPSVPVATNILAAPGPIALPASTPGGASPGFLLTDEKGGQHFAPAPLATYNKQTIGSSLEPAGNETDPQTGLVINDVYKRKLMQADGSFKYADKLEKYPHGVVPEELQGVQPSSSSTPNATLPPSVQYPVTSQPQTFAQSGGRIGVELAAKNKQEALNDLSRQASLLDAMAENIKIADKAVQEYNDAALVEGTNPLRALNPLSQTAAAIDASKGEFTSSIMKSLQGAGRVSTQEVQYAAAAYPDKRQPKQVQLDNIKYLRDFNETAKQREKYAFQEVLGGKNPAIANQDAIQKFPIPPPPGYVPSGGAQPASPSSQGSYQIKATTPDAIKAEALQAKQRGYTRIITPDGQEHVLTNGQ